MNRQILPSVTLTKGFGYLWDHVCHVYTPLHAHVGCDKSLIGSQGFIFFKINFGCFLVICHFFHPYQHLVKGSMIT